MNHGENLNLYVLFSMLLLASGVAVVTKWVKLPYSIALVIVGLLIGVFHWLPVVAMTPELILLIFLPVLLFEASWNLHFETLKKCWKPVTAFATVGVMVSTVTVGLVLHALTSFDLKIALLFGSMISATDPISVLALFKSLNVNRRLHTILEGESLLNDGTAVALFRIFLAAILAGGDFSWTTIAVDFVSITCGGIAVGAAAGFLASKATRYFDDHLLETTLTVLVAYGSYICAEHLHVSAVIAVLTSGIVMGNFGSRQRMSASTRLLVDSFWEYAAFIAESLVFLLIGMQIKFDLLIKYSPSILAGVVAILIARFVVIYGLSPLVSSKQQPIPMKWRALLLWGGLRGSLCMAMALSLPMDFPQREAVIVTTFGVALFTLLVPGLTVEPLVKLLKVIPVRTSKTAQLELQLSRLDNEKKRIDSLVRQNKMERKHHRKEIEKLRDKKEETEQLLQLAYAEPDSATVLERLQVDSELVMAQKDRLNELSNRGHISSEVIEDYRRSLDEKQLRVRSEREDAAHAR